MKRKYFLLIPCLFLSTLFIKDFYLRQVRATSSWYATFTYNDKTYAFSHSYQQIDWNSIIPGFANSVNASPDGNTGAKGQNWCNNTLVADGEDNNYDDWFLPNRDELGASQSYQGSNPWNLSGSDPKLWSSSTHDYIGRYHRAFARTDGGNYILDKVEFNYARCVRVVSGPPPPDFKLLLASWGSANLDLNGDGIVNGMDFGKMLGLIQ